MRALVVYESMYGNTHAVASNIADGLSATHEVTLVPVARATPELVAAADLLVAGGPTHMHGMSTATSRKAAADAARKPGSGLTMDAEGTEGAGPGEPGLRGWLERFGETHALAAAFDTRLSAPPVFTGRASLGISRLLKRHGCRITGAPESFLVTKQNTLLGGEASRARDWGAALGTAAKNAYASV